MKIVEKGHIYELRLKRPVKDGDDPPPLVFVNQERGHEHNGTTTQEVLRALLDRTRHCNNCLPHPNNERIVYHLRMALVLHEARALERKTEKGEIYPEYLALGDDQHFILRADGYTSDATTILETYIPDWDKKPKHEDQ